MSTTTLLSFIIILSLWTCGIVCKVVRNIKCFMKNDTKNDNFFNKKLDKKCDVLYDVYNLKIRGVIMTKTKEVIREILQNYQIERIRSKGRKLLISWLCDNFFVTSVTASYICNKLKTYSAEALYFIYFPELR